MAPAIKRNKGQSIFENVFPNPASSDQFLIVLSEYQDVILQLTDSKGSLIFRKNADSRETCFSVNTLPKGIYILSAAKAGWLESQKLVLN
jgi:hypothetical protein